jgi:hypothetical protein
MISGGSSIKDLFFAEEFNDNLAAKKEKQND